MKTFKIKRFSWLSDEYDEGITALEIEDMLNKAEVPMLVGFGNPLNKRAKWEVEEIK